MRVLPVTAWSMCSGLGPDLASTRAALLAGRDGLRTIDTLDGAPLPRPFVVGAVDANLPALAASWSARDTRIVRMAALLVDGVSEAIAGVRARYGADRVGVYLGTSTAGLAATEAAARALHTHGALPAGYDFVRQHAYAALLDAVRDLAGLHGPGHIISTACSSSGKVFATASRQIEAGVIDAALVGGIDTLCQLTLRGFAALGAISYAPCRPFSAQRDGINIGEGGALFVLDPRGDGPICVRGVGESSDAHHMSAPHPQGHGAAAAIRAALVDAGVEAWQVDHVNAHGTGTPLNDAAESSPTSPWSRPRAGTATCSVPPAHSKRPSAPWPSATGCCRPRCVSRRKIPTAQSELSPRLCTRRNAWL
jgi:3-oxoacyl-[acyl-carrier-protein] synthase I